MIIDVFDRGCECCDDDDKANLIDRIDRVPQFLRSGMSYVNYGGCRFQMFPSVAGMHARIYTARPLHVQGPEDCRKRIQRTKKNIVEFFPGYYIQPETFARDGLVIVRIAEGSWRTRDGWRPLVQKVANADALVALDYFLETGQPHPYWAR